MRPAGPHHRRQRGTTILEVIVAMSVLAVATTGLLVTMRHTLESTAVAHRRTAATLLRTGMVERLAVARRTLVTGIAAAGGWVVESCYDAEARPTATNAGFAAAFACPDGAAYRRMIRAVSVPDAAGADQGVWTVNVYVERIDRPCTADARYASLGCVGADLYITD